MHEAVHLKSRRRWTHRSTASHVQSIYIYISNNTKVHFAFVFNSTKENPIHLAYKSCTYIKEMEVSVCEY